MLRFKSMLLILLIGLCTPAIAQVYHKIQGTALWLAPPKGYEVSRDFTGFINKETGSSILVIALPSDLATQTYRQFQNNDKFIKILKEQGFDVTSQSDDKTRDGLDLKIYSGTQKDKGLIYKRWSTMLIAPQGGYVINIQSLQDKDLTAETATEILRTARIFGAPEQDEEIATLPFSIKVMAPFVVETVIMGNTVHLTASDAKNSTHIFISQELDRTAPGDTKKAQDSYLSSISNAFKVLDGAKEKIVMFAGSAGRMIEGIGETKAEEQDFMLYTSVDNQGRVLYLHATAKKGTLETYRNIIQEIAMSIVPRPIE